MHLTVGQRHGKQRRLAPGTVDDPNGARRASIVEELNAMRFKGLADGLQLAGEN